MAAPTAINASVLLNFLKYRWSFFDCFGNLTMYIYIYIVCVCVCVCACGGLMQVFNVNKHRPHSSLYKFRVGATCFLLDSWTLKMLLICRPETSVRNYHYSLYNSSEEHSCQRLNKLRGPVLLHLSYQFSVPLQLYFNFNFGAHKYNAIRSRCLIWNLQWILNTHRVKKRVSLCLQINSSKKDALNRSIWSRFIMTAAWRGNLKNNMVVVVGGEYVPFLHCNSTSLEVQD